MTRQSKMTIAQQFAEYFETERRLEEYQAWTMGDLTQHLKDLEWVESRIATKGRYTRKQKKMMTQRRNELREAIKYDDPRRIPAGDVTSWLFSIGFIPEDSPIPVVNDLRSKFRGIMHAAVTDSESFKDLMISPFYLDAEGSSLYYMVKTPDQYQLDNVKGSLTNTEKRIKNQQKKRRKVSRTQEGYGEETKELGVILSASESSDSVVLSVTAELKPLMVQLCQAHERMELNRAQFEEFMRWKQENPTQTA